jgi:acyl-CoA thioester hydrolase
MEIRVYYEDTDAAGVVYHSNYLNYCERARTEFFRAKGFPVGVMAEEGSIFPVVRMEIDFKSGARHDELLRVSTQVTEVSGSTFMLRQQIKKVEDEKLLVDLIVRLACVTENMKAKRIPLVIREMLTAEMEKWKAA